MIVSQIAASVILGSLHTIRFLPRLFPISSVISFRSGIAVSVWLTPNGVVLASLLGLFIPCVAAILPIRAALSSNLQVPLVHQ